MKSKLRMFIKTDGSDFHEMTGLDQYVGTVTIESRGKKKTLPVSVVTNIRMETDISVTISKKLEGGGE